MLYLPTVNYVYKPKTNDFQGKIQSNETFFLITDLKIIVNSYFHLNILVVNIKCCLKINKKNLTHQLKILLYHDIKSKIGKFRWNLFIAWFEITVYFSLNRVISDCTSGIKRTPSVNPFVNSSVIIFSPLCLWLCRHAPHSQYCHEDDTQPQRHNRYCWM